MGHKPTLGRPRLSLTTQRAIRHMSVDGIRQKDIAVYLNISISSVSTYGYGIGKVGRPVKWAVINMQNGLKAATAFRVAKGSLAA